MKTTKEDIIAIAARLFVSKGYEGTGMAEIAGRVGLSNSSCLFSHFKSKEELYRKVVEKYLLSEQNPHEKFSDYENLSLREFIDCYINKVEESMQLMKESLGMEEDKKTPLHFLSFVLESGEWYDDYAKAAFARNEEEIALWESMIRRARKSGEIRADIDIYQTAAMFRYAFVGISYVYALKGGLTTEAMRQLLYGMYIMIVSA